MKTDPSHTHTLAQRTEDGRNAAAEADRRATTAVENKDACCMARRTTPRESNMTMIRKSGSIVQYLRFVTVNMRLREYIYGRMDPNEEVRERSNFDLRIDALRWNANLVTVLTLCDTLRE
jgi:hypothetical protein